MNEAFTKKFLFLFWDGQLQKLHFASVRCHFSVVFFFFLSSQRKRLFCSLFFLQLKTSEIVFFRKLNFFIRKIVKVRDRSSFSFEITFFGGLVELFFIILFPFSKFLFQNVKRIKKRNDWWKTPSLWLLPWKINSPLIFHTTILFINKSTLNKFSFIQVFINWFTIKFTILI